MESRGLHGRRRLYAEPSHGSRTVITSQPPMGRASYEIGKFFGRWFYALSIKSEVLRPHLAERSGGYLLACTHISHLEPFILSCLIKRRVDWMARIEFYRRAWAR